jgi:hypothetical protein
VMSAAIGPKLADAPRGPYSQLQASRSARPPRPTDYTHVIHLVEAQGPATPP